MDIFLSVVILVIVPLLLGNAFCGVFNKENSLANYYIYGYMVLFGFMQIVSVPLVLMMQPYRYVYYAMIGFIVIFSTVGIVLRISKADIKFKKITLIEAICVVMMLLASFYFLSQTFNHQYYDDDDSRFLVNVSDILVTDAMYLTDPTTGDITDWFRYDDSFKDVVAPWATYIALLCKFTNISVPIMAHTIMPLALYALAICCWWAISGNLFNKNKMYQSMFVIFILMLIVYGSYQEVSYGEIIAQNVFVKFLSRIWQGKSVVASIGIPAMFLSLFDFYDNRNIRNTLAVLIVNLAICFMSSNGTVIGAVMIGGFSLAYMIVKKNFFIGLQLAILAIPNFIFYLVSSFVRAIGG